MRTVQTACQQVGCCDYCPTPLEIGDHVTVTDDGGIYHDECDPGE